MPWKDPWNWFPFLLAVGTEPHFNLQRILEALVIAGVTGAIVMWGTQQVLEERISSLQRDVQSIQTDVQQLRRDVYVPRGGR